MPKDLEDLSLHLKHDRRWLAAFGFLAVVGVAFLFTDTWREPPAKKTKKIAPKVQEKDDSVLPLLDFEKDLKELKQQREENRILLERTERDMGTSQKEINDHLSSLVNRLESVSTRLNSASQNLGDRGNKKAESKP